MPQSAERHAAFIDAVVSHIQVAAGAAPYATRDELIEIFSSLADCVPHPETQLDLMVLRRLLASVTRQVYVRAGADPPLRPIVNRVADADDPRVEFRAAMAALRTMTLR